jgi:hypothetical protein
VRRDLSTQQGGGSGLSGLGIDAYAEEAQPLRGRRAYLEEVFTDTAGEDEHAQPAFMWTLRFSATEAAALRASPGERSVPRGPGHRWIDPPCTFPSSVTRNALLLRRSRSRPGPTLICLAYSATPSETSSNTPYSMNSLKPAAQHWPWWKKIALAPPGIATSMSASAKTTFGNLPPSSNVTFLSLPLAASMMRLPSWGISLLRGADQGPAGHGRAVPGHRQTGPGIVTAEYTRT